MTPNQLDLFGPTVLDLLVGKSAILEGVTMLKPLGAAGIAEDQLEVFPIVERAPLDNLAAIAQQAPTETIKGLGLAFGWDLDNVTGSHLIWRRNFTPPAHFTLFATPRSLSPASLIISHVLL